MAAATSKSNGREVGRRDRIREEVVDLLAMIVRLVEEWPDGADTTAQPERAPGDLLPGNLDTRVYCWRCEECGEAPDMRSGRWGVAGERGYFHAHGEGQAQIRVPARCFGLWMDVANAERAPGERYTMHHCGTPPMWEIRDRDGSVVARRVLSRSAETECARLNAERGGEAEEAMSVAEYLGRTQLAEEHLAVERAAREKAEAERDAARAEAASDRDMADRHAGETEHWMQEHAEISRRRLADQAESAALRSQVSTLTDERDEARAAADGYASDIAAIILCMNRNDYPHHPEYPDDDEITHRITEMAAHRDAAQAEAARLSAEEKRHAATWLRVNSLAYEWSCESSEDGVRRGRALREVLYSSPPPPLSSRSDDARGADTLEPPPLVGTFTRGLADPTLLDEAVPTPPAAAPLLCVWGDCDRPRVDPSLHCAEHQTEFAEWNSQPPPPDSEPATDALLPCPFCRSAPLMLHEGSVAFSWVRCPKCGCETGDAGSPEQAVAAWNRRTPPPATVTVPEGTWRAVVEALEHVQEWCSCSGARCVQAALAAARAAAPKEAPCTE